MVLATERAGDATQSSRRRPWFVLLVVLVLIGVGVALTAQQPATAARHGVAVHALGTEPSADWALGGRATVVSDATHRTVVVARVTRLSASTATPALTSSFDGSGGGEAVVVTCSSDAAPWTVAVGATQSIGLSCDHAVQPFAVERLAFVHLGVR